MAHSNSQDQMVRRALDAASREEITVHAPEATPQYSWTGSRSVLNLRPSPMLYLGGMPLIDFARWAKDLVQKNDAQAKKIKELEQALYLAGRALASVGSPK